MNKNELAHLRICTINELRNRGLASQGWNFEWNQRRRTYGSCNDALRTIYISRALAEANTFAEMWDTVLHEIAHALTPGHGHDSQWREMCVHIGARPEEFKYATLAPPRWYAANCPCAHVFVRDRLAAAARNASCGRCGTSLQWEKNTLKLSREELVELKGVKV